MDGVLTEIKRKVTIFVHYTLYKYIIQSEQQVDTNTDANKRCITVCLFICLLVCLKPASKFCYSKGCILVLGSHGMQHPCMKKRTDMKFKTMFINMHCALNIVDSL